MVISMLLLPARPALVMLSCYKDILVVTDLVCIQCHPAARLKGVAQATSECQLTCNLIEQERLAPWPCTL